MSLFTTNTDSINSHHDKVRYLMVWSISLLFIFFSVGTELNESLIEEMDGQYQRNESEYLIQISDLDE